MMTEDQKAAKAERVRLAEVHASAVRASADSHLPKMLDMVAAAKDADPAAIMALAGPLTDACESDAEIEGLNMALSIIKDTANALSLAIKPDMDRRAGIASLRKKLSKEDFETLQTIGIEAVIPKTSEVKSTTVA